MVARRAAVAQLVSRRQQAKAEDEEKQMKKTIAEMEAM